MDDVGDFLESVEPARRHREAAQLDAFFRDVTGWQPVLWSGSMLGYGQYDYTYASGRTGRYFATGFAPRKAKLSIYIMPGYADFSGILERLGKHSKGKSCLYLNKLEDADLDVLAELVRAGLADLAKSWPVRST
ncbi:DUF1801 domain-containing protein [Sulfitobacter pacificus]|uniref:YdhG-like domain-containing protein n=1 Tax=Sulfitobacter pacificus TaxID=1499314 RepID=A0ABQ5VL54_9RHOB|nr:DUF1801 domain-containing protein [Sulfitobacter pacificus]GLQ27876.1 hypothetical protein GCM10007927_26790 [Sulfitobacter pacificus]